MRRSSHTLLGRIHERVRLEAAHDVRGLYGFIDPVLRERWEARRQGEPARVLEKLRCQVESVRSADVEEVEILEARKVSEHHGGRPAAIVRSVVRYNGEPVARESRTTWVRNEGVWYSTAVEGRGAPDP